MVASHIQSPVGNRNLPETDSTFLPARAVRERYGISFMSLWRWINDPRMGFPPPIYFSRYRYWRLADIEAWEASRSDIRGAA